MMESRYAIQAASESGQVKAVNLSPINVNAPAPEYEGNNVSDGDSLAVFSAIGAKVGSAVPLWIPQPLRGIAVHLLFSRTVSALGGSYHAEASYINHEVSYYGEKGSVRADAVYGSIRRPQVAVDLKTGAARITNKDKGRYEKNLPIGTRLYQISVPP